jgi:microcystin-dependent protein
LSQHFLGETGGTESVTLLQTEIPSHTHSLNALIDDGDTRIPDSQVSMAKSQGGNMYAPAATLVPMAFETAALVGGGLPHNNMQPYLTFNFCIAMQGIFPPRT